MVTQTACDAVMIGRTAASNPWIFRQIEQYTTRAGAGVVSWAKGTGAFALPCEPSSNPAGGSTNSWESPEGHGFSDAEETKETAASGAEAPPYDHPTESDRYQMIRTYFEMLIEEELPDAAGKMKQFASWFTHGVPGGAALRKAIYDAKIAAEILTRVEEFFEKRLQPEAQIT